MKTFKNFEEIKPYYNEETNTYEFIENDNLIDIVIEFELDINSNIRAGDIKARDIIADDIKARNINARDINAGNINAWDINAKYIIARDISAENINANNILYYSVCYASSKFVCNSIKGTRPNSKHFCLDSEIVIKGDKKNVK